MGFGNGLFQSLETAKAAVVWEDKRNNETKKWYLDKKKYIRDEPYK